MTEGAQGSELLVGHVSRLTNGRSVHSSEEVEVSEREIGEDAGI